MEERFHGTFLLPTVLLENLPQLAIQVFYLANNDVNIVVLLSIVSTSLMVLATLLKIVTSHFFLQHKQMVLKHVAERYIIFGIQVMMKHTDVINTAFELALTNTSFGSILNKSKFAAWQFQEKDYREKRNPFQRRNTMPALNMGITADFQEDRLRVRTFQKGDPSSKSAVERDMEFWQLELS